MAGPAGSGVRPPVRPEEDGSIPRNPSAIQDHNRVGKGVVEALSDCRYCRTTDCWLLAVDRERSNLGEERGLSSNDATLDTGATVVYRRRDIEALVDDLRAHGYLVDVDFTFGTQPADYHSEQVEFSPVPQSRCPTSTCGPLPARAGRV